MIYIPPDSKRYTTRHIWSNDATNSVVNRNKAEIKKRGRIMDR